MQKPTNKQPFFVDLTNTFIASYVFFMHKNKSRKNKELCKQITVWENRCKSRLQGCVKKDKKAPADSEGE